MLLPNDIRQLSHMGISQEKLKTQLDRFVTGFPYLRIASSAKVGSGIRKLTTDEENNAIRRWEQYLADGGDVIKMVPASGAASRMFKALFSFLDSEDDIPPHDSPAMTLIDNLDRTPFVEELDETLTRSIGITLHEAIEARRYKDIVRALLGKDGMDYGNMPKGLIPFHRYADGSTRTPIEEQMIEGSQTALGRDGKVRVHFTVSPSHRQHFKRKLETILPSLEKRIGARFEATLSEQKPSTDTIAANLDNTPMRGENGQLIFRPGGHGALIENLNDLDATVIFLKNIDNVVPDSHRDDTIRYKRVLAGYLVSTHDTISRYLRKLNTGDYDINDLRQMIRFMHDILFLRDPLMKSMEDAELALYIKRKLDRPLRVCGMVKNEGEPGGGPFIAYNPDGSTSPQILESNQIDPDNHEYLSMVKAATHFNPVDLVCFIKNINGEKYNLPDYVDPMTGFISKKSLHGKELKAMELPGLWNGAMSDWNTIFIEVPITTFNPVKTVNDLLRPSHQQI